MLFRFTSWIKINRNTHTHSSICKTKKNISRNYYKSIENPTDTEHPLTFPFLNADSEDLFSNHIPLQLSINLLFKGHSILPKGHSIDTTPTPKTIICKEVKQWVGCNTYPVTCNAMAYTHLALQLNAAVLL